LKEGDMTDEKLTEQENKIRDMLRNTNKNFTLVQAQQGVWGEGVAIIAIERV
jgi:hypothetical protein